MNRKQTIQSLLDTVHTMRQNMMFGYSHHKEATITPSQACVLRFVAKHPSANIKSIAQTLHITSSAATQLVDNLVEKGYVTRKDNPLDRRAITLELSDKAHGLFKEFEDHAIQKMTSLFEVLSDDELAQYATLSKKITDNIINAS